jgi:uncharacterized protein
MRSYRKTDMRILYLHGFASSPQSSKAQFFGLRFAEAKIPFTAPALDGGDFEHLSITSQLEIVQSNIAEKCILMGSSLGGYLAALYAVRHPEQVERLILLAPAFHFLERWQQRLSPVQIADWRRRGSIPIYHYGSKCEQPLGYQLIEDAQAYEAEPAITQPALILHGAHDEVVPASGSEAIAAGRPNVTLRLFPSGHELTDVMDGLWAETAAFLGLGT